MIGQYIFQKLQQFITQFIMAEGGLRPQDWFKFIGIAGLSLGVNHIIHTLLNKKPKSHHKNIVKESTSLKQLSLNSIQQIPEDSQFKLRQAPPKSFNDLWGTIQLNNINQSDTLLIQLDMMTRIVCPFVKVNNLIIDLQIHNPKTYPCPLVAKGIKFNKNQPFLNPQSLVKPGEFVLQNCVFRAGQSIQTEKKFLRAGPRATQYFVPSDVRADIVCCGKIAPGINNIIRQLVILLHETYKVQSVTGVRYSFKGYQDDNYLNLLPQMVETIHHRGGCYLGVSTTSKFNIQKIINSLIKRNINQVYLTGGNDTNQYAVLLYQQIKKRKLNIAMCVNLKAINKDIAYFDTCFGFQTAVEQTQKFIQEGYAICKSNYNSVGFIKVPGTNSGFLAMDAVRAARNANICLVPQFKYDIHGEQGLLNYIVQRVKAKGYCIVVYSQGALNSINDLSNKALNEMHEQNLNIDHYLSKQLKKKFRQKNIQNFNIFKFDCSNSVRSAPANSFDTKLCCQIALCSIQGLMCGYTGFAIGHLKNRVAMVPIEMMTCAQRYRLQVYEENWQRLLANTRQPSFRNNENEAQM